MEEMEGVEEVLTEIHPRRTIEELMEEMEKDQLFLDMDPAMEVLDRGIQPESSANQTDKFTHMEDMQ